MTHSIFLAGAAAIAVAFAFQGPDLSQALLPPSAVPTSLADWACGPAAPAAAGPASAGSTRCPGHGGAAVTLEDGPDGAALGLAWSSTAATGPLVSGVDRSIPVEWRGRPSSRGFAPHAAIVRVARGDGQPAAAVLRVAPGEACLVAHLVGADAETAARRLADGRARAFRCGRDAPEDERKAGLAGAHGLQRTPRLG